MKKLIFPWAVVIVTTFLVLSHAFEAYYLLLIYGFNDQSDLEVYKMLFFIPVWIASIIYLDFCQSEYRKQIRMIALQKRKKAKEQEEKMEEARLKDIMRARKFI